MSTAIPARQLIGYVTGAVLLLGGASLLRPRFTRHALALLGTWILVLVALIYVPFLTQALSEPSIGAQLTGINYFADTLLVRRCDPGARVDIQRRLVSSVERMA